MCRTYFYCAFHTRREKSQLLLLPLLSVAKGDRVSGTPAVKVAVAAAGRGGRKREGGGEATQLSTFPFSPLLLFPFLIPSSSFFLPCLSSAPYSTAFLLPS